MDTVHVHIDMYLKARLQRIVTLLSADDHEMDPQELKRHISSAEDLVYRLKMQRPDTGKGHHLRKSVQKNASE